MRETRRRHEATSVVDANALRIKNMSGGVLRSCHRPGVSSIRNKESEVSSGHWAMRTQCCTPGQGAMLCAVSSLPSRIEPEEGLLLGSSLRRRRVDRREERGLARGAPGPADERERL